MSELERYVGTTTCDLYRQVSDFLKKSFIANLTSYIRRDKAYLKVINDVIDENANWKTNNSFDREHYVT